VLSALGTRTGGGGSAISSTFPVNTAVDIPAPEHGVLAGPAQEQASRRTDKKTIARRSRTNTFSQICGSAAMIQWPARLAAFAELRGRFCGNRPGIRGRTANGWVGVTGILLRLPENSRWLTGLRDQNRATDVPLCPCTVRLPQAEALAPIFQPFADAVPPRVGFSRAGRALS
jgi:hypothetical protein